MNILLTSVGRRAYMVKYFKEALGETGQVHVCNSDDLTVAFLYADKCVVTPLIYDNEYIPFLLNYCMENKIDMLLSLFDIDLLVLAKNKERFAEIGTQVIVSNVPFVESCNDKWKTYQFLNKNGFFTPKTYLTLNQTLEAIDSGELHYPVIVKPRFGCGSIALSVAEDEVALRHLHTYNTRAIERTYLKYESAQESEKLIYQECLSGQEYGGDVINDLAGNFSSAIVKKKIAMRAGETDIAEVVDDPELYSVLKRLGELTGHIGNLDCDLFLVDGVPYVLEMNARFGGGYPFSHAAGCNLPAALIRWVQGQEVPDSWLTATGRGVIFKELVLTVNSAL